MKRLYKWVIFIFEKLNSVKNYFKENGIKLYFLFVNFKFDLI